MFIYVKCRVRFWSWTQPCEVWTDPLDLKAPTEPGSTKI